MQIKYKRLDSGYHYACAVGFAHLFAQWPPGTPCDTSSVSAGEMPPSIDTIDAFIEAAQRAADSRITSSGEINAHQRNQPDQSYGEGAFDEQSGAG